MRRDGFALVFSLLAIAAVELLTLASLSLAMHEVLVADARQRTITASRAAETALASVINRWPIPGSDSLAVGQHLMLSGANQVSIDVERTAWGLFYVRASATAGGATIRRAAVLRQLDIERGIIESNEAVVAGGSVVAPQAMLSIGPATDCILPVRNQQAPTHLTVTNHRRAIGIAETRIDSAHAVPPDGYAFAGLRWDEVASIADARTGTSIHLGVPDSADAPLYPLIYADNDLTITAGRGQGLIFVRGNLRIESGVQFRGIIIVHGTAHVADDVHITGTLRIQGAGMSVLGRATFTHSSCAVAAALKETPAAQRLIRAIRIRIPAF